MWLGWLVGSAVEGQEGRLRLRTKDSHQLYGLQNFGAKIHCSVNSCVSGARVQWHHDGKPLTQGTQVTLQGFFS